jgi:hypothetical protein
MRSTTQPRPVSHLDEGIVRQIKDICGEKHVLMSKDLICYGYATNIRGPALCISGIAKSLRS